MHVLRVHYNANLSARPALLIFTLSEMKLPYTSGEIIPIGANILMCYLLYYVQLQPRNLHLQKVLALEFHQIVPEMKIATLQPLENCCYSKTKHQFAIKQIIIANPGE